ncbi:MAG: class I SAM-dependent methyltransferase [Solirubrobacterales bacterium]|nr:class I SAM-dependent methyltransferase [Solirubrobacterales bacterium]
MGYRRRNGTGHSGGAARQRVQCASRGDGSERVGRSCARYLCHRQDDLHHVQGDILDPPFRRGSFDLVVADQVLHHTPDCHRAFLSMAGLVRPGGQLAAYVYRVKPFLRELADEKVREITTQMSTDECMKSVSR